MMYWTTAVGGENADAFKRINGEKKKREVGAQEFDVKQNKNILYNLLNPMCRQSVTHQRWNRNQTPCREHGWKEYQQQKKEIGIIDLDCGQSMQAVGEYLGEKRCRW